MVKTISTGALVVGSVVIDDSPEAIVVAAMIGTVVIGGILSNILLFGLCISILGTINFTITIVLNSTGILTTIVAMLFVFVLMWVLHL